MTHIFISYSKKDTRDLALALADALNTIQGVTAWVDRSLRAGQSWELQIQTEIDRCDTMIVLYSPDINRHKQGESQSYVLTEIAYAKYTAKKPILPVMAQTTEPPMSLTMEHYIDFTLKGVTVDDLVTALCDELGIEMQQAAPPAAPAKATEAPKPQPKPAPAKAAEVPKPQPAKSTPAPQPKPKPDASADAVKRLLGEPFDWCEVPAGEFLYGEDKQKLRLPALAIAKYPITYSQFQVFMDAKDGFKEGRWWDGLAQNQSEEPGDQSWKINDHPRENVSWYDAMAFCRWLSFKLGGGYAIDKLDEWLIRLPTEFEWEKAARGTDGRLYPYGNKFDKKKGNTSESGIKQTTPVTAYPQGASPYGVMDMSGNVWEWCLSDSSNPAPEARKENISSNVRRVLRGGSWSYAPDYARAVTRLDYYPDYRSLSIGFRVLRPPSPTEH